MKTEQQIMEQRLLTFMPRQSECLAPRFYTAPHTENFLTAEQIHVHYARGHCKTEYTDIVEFWLHSLFNFLEDRFEEHKLAQYVAQSQWKCVEPDEISKVTSVLFKKIHTSHTLEIGKKQQKAFEMLCNREVIAFLLETKEAYLSFFWSAGTD